ncbi:MAG TPA: valine--tRNA ligase [Bacteroidia bacterium]|jgi:valyl-tRNA synthetase|nr:valine--tRNA ligase [Bacteroidia bacterium]
MEIPKTYDPKSTEDKWYSYWLKQKFFKSVPDKREPYTIVIPPPNVTGVLHMGHMLNNTIQDVLIRRARLQGKNACWVPGTDHASIATEAKVVAMLKEKGIKKSDLSREEFLKYAWEWKEKYGGIILKQLEKLGASCDWDRTRFTMEDDLSEAVIDVFIDLHQKGQIYRGVRMVNWDPVGLTAVSDEEVNHKELNSRLFYVRYKLADEKGKPLEGDSSWITIATTRPETILGDTAVCVHPDDERYKHLKGKHCIIPMVNRVVPIIFDTYIDLTFGTGALKVTPAHDINDYNLGVKHGLEVIDTIAADGKMSPAAQFYVGEDRFAVRKKIIKDLEELGQVVKIEDIKNKVGYSERTDAVIEPKLSMQWFLKMDKVSKPALENVLNGEIRLIPDKFQNTYKHWMENVHDWCISRQLWWGQRIPAWYNEKGDFVVAKTQAEAISGFKELNAKRTAEGKPALPVENLRQDEDVLDTWFSSWLWPISVFDGFKNPKGADINYYYPTNDLVTAPEILFFWVARMIIAGYEYRGQKPFTNVYLTGIVRDKQGRKMSKSLGNSPDPIELIEKFGADGVRVGMLLCSPAGNDLPFDESYCEQGRNFSNKIWNAFRLVKGWEVDTGLAQSQASRSSIQWFESRFNQQLAEINDLYSKYRISEVLMTTYKLIWDDFCAWYLEMIKPEFVDGKALPVDKPTYDATISFLEKLLKVVHPFTPFITEEIWHLIAERDEKDCIIVSEWPRGGTVDQKLLADFEIASEVITHVRNIRKQKNLSPKEKLSLCFKGSLSPSDLLFRDIVMRLANLDSYEAAASLPANATTFMVKQSEYAVPLTQNLDPEAEKERLVKELEYNKGFLESVQKKLANERFVQNAKPEILANENKKKEDAEAKIRAIEEQLGALK